MEGLHPAAALEEDEGKSLFRGWTHVDLGLLLQEGMEKEAD